MSRREPLFRPFKKVPGKDYDGWNMNDHPSYRRLDDVEGTPRRPGFAAIWPPSGQQPAPLPPLFWAAVFLLAGLSIVGSIRVQKPALLLGSSIMLALALLKLLKTEVRSD
jgi:hypothetical protein